MIRSGQSRGVDSSDPGTLHLVAVFIIDVAFAIWHIVIELTFVSNRRVGVKDSSLALLVSSLILALIFQAVLVVIHTFSMFLSFLEISFISSFRLDQFA